MQKNCRKFNKISSNFVNVWGGGGRDQKRCLLKKGSLQNSRSCRDSSILGTLVILDSLQSVDKQRE